MRDMQSILRKHGDTAVPVIRPGRGLRNGPFLSPKPPIPTSLQTSRTVFTDDRDAGKENPVIPYRNRPAHLQKKIAIPFIRF